MPLFTKGSRSVLFVHVPKTGGTSVEAALMDAGWQRFLYEDNPALVDRSLCSPQHYHAPLLHATLRMDRIDAVFMIVRDPIARFRSEYAWQALGADEGAAAVVEEWTRSAFKTYADDPFHLDNHLRPQVEFALDEGDIYRYEEGLDNIVADVNSRLRLDIWAPLERRHDSSTAGVLNSKDVEINGTVEALLRDVYADDFRLLGY